MGETLYDQLMKLCRKGDAFFFKDHERDGRRYRVFSYRCPTFSDFCQPGAIECRGIMYEIDKDGWDIRIACRPMEKFFNLNENPLTMKVDLSRVVAVMDKVDGSLISSFESDGHLRLKSKASLTSVQALDASDWLAKPEQSEFRRAVEALTKSFHTVNMEWTAPHNRVVVKYQEPSLTVLNVRHNGTGNYLKPELAQELFPVLARYWVRRLPPDMLGYGPEVVRAMQGLEGFIYQLDNGQLIKMKTDWYCSIHRAKEQALNFRFVLESVLDEGADDLRQMLLDDPAALKLLDRVERKVRPWLSTTMARTEEFFEQNRNLDRKSFSLLAQKECPELHHLVMQAYSGRELDYRTYAIKRYDFVKEQVCGLGGPDQQDFEEAG